MVKRATKEIPRKSKAADARKAAAREAERLRLRETCRKLKQSCDSRDRVIRGFERELAQKERIIGLIRERSKEEQELEFMLNEARDEYQAMKIKWANCFNELQELKRGKEKTN